MGTHPIFESDFDCLTECKSNRLMENQYTGGFCAIIVLVLLFIAYEVPSTNANTYSVYHPYELAVRETTESTTTTTTVSTTTSASFPVVDVVYTWVNGSDPTFVNSLKHTDLGMKSNKDDTKAQRFADFNQLMYSLRSVEMYAPWIRKIWIVTNGQRVNWLSTNKTIVDIVSHDQIFSDKNHLPTFNSRSIESHLHQIPGISENFLYFNDDFTLTNPTSLDDFWTEEEGYKLKATSKMKNDIFKKKPCSPWCLSKMSDGQCHQGCNILQCLWDGNDCDGVMPKGGETDPRPTYFKALDFVHTLFEMKLSPGATRYKLPHVPIMINTQIMSELQSAFEPFYEVTSRHRKRQKNDMQFEFSYTNWLLGAANSTFPLSDTNLYKHTRRGGGIFYMPYWNDMKKNRLKFAEFKAKQETIKFICINDLLDHSKPQAAAAKKELMAFYDKLYPSKSQYEQ